MRDLLLLGLLGIGIGGFYGVLGTGIVVGHKGSGLINLDQGALAMYPAYAFVTMRSSGTVFFPWFDFIPGPIDVPVSVTLSDGPAEKWLALVVGLAMSVLLGIMVQALVFGPLRRKPPVSKVIGSLGALLYLQSIAVHHFGAKAQFVDGVLPGGGFDNPLGLGGRLPYDRLAFALIALLIGGALSIYYRTTRMGIATRAVEDSELGASLLGYSPNRIAMINWLLSTTTTGLAGILALDIVSLTPSRYTLLVVPALGAALFGNLTSPWLAAVGGVMLGVFQSFSAGLTLESWWPSWLPEEGVRQAVPLIVIVAFQYRRGHLLPVRSSGMEERQPKAEAMRRVWPTVALVVVSATIVLWNGGRVVEGKLLTTVVAAILMLASVVLVGYLGQISLANLAMAGTAAYLATRFAADGSQFGVSPLVIDGPGWPAPLAALCGVAVAVGVGVLVAIPALRIRGLQLALVTLAAAVALSELVLGNEALIGNGARSIVTVPPPSWFGVDVGVVTASDGLPDRTNLAIFATSWLVALILAVAGLRRGTVGRRFLAVRANERAAAASGVDVVHAKLLGFGIASAIAGTAGVLISYHQTVLQITTWSALAGIGNLALLFLGGVGRISGALLGGMLTPGGLLSETSADGEVLRNAVSGALMIAVAVFRPDGLTSLLRPLGQLARRSVRRPSSFG